MFPRFLNPKRLPPILFITIIVMMECVHQVWSDDVRKATGYIGEQVILKLDVNATWKFTSIAWSVYGNFTYISRFPMDIPKTPIEFEGRLELNTTSGDLTIKNVMSKDELEYKVQLRTTTGDKATIDVQLSVQDRVLKPNITLLHSFLDAEKCVLFLKCSSLSSKVSLSWKLEPGFTEHFCSDSNFIRESVMWTSFSTNRDVIFSCIATDGTNNESSKWSGKCQDSGQELSSCSQECVNGSSAYTAKIIGALIGGLIVGFVLGLIGRLILFRVINRVNKRYFLNALQMFLSSTAVSLAFSLFSQLQKNLVFCHKKFFWSSCRFIVFNELTLTKSRAFRAVYS